MAHIQTKSFTDIMKSLSHSESGQKAARSAEKDASTHKIAEKIKELQEILSDQLHDLNLLQDTAVTLSDIELLDACYEVLETYEIELMVHLEKLNHFEQQMQRVDFLADRLKDDLFSTEQSIKKDETVCLKKMISLLKGYKPNSSHLFDKIIDMKNLKEVFKQLDKTSTQTEVKATKEGFEKLS